MAALKILLAVLLLSRKVCCSVQEAGECLKFLEAHVQDSSQTGHWKNMRDDFIAAINEANDTSGIDELLEQLRSFESNIEYSSKTESWKQWKRNYWRVMTDPTLEISDTITRFIISLMFLEAEISVPSFNWMMSVRYAWLNRCRALIDPLHKLFLYDEMYLNVDNLLDKFGYSSLQEYEREVNMVISNINSAAEKLDQMAKDTGIADVTAGGLGILSGVGLIFVPHVTIPILFVAGTVEALRQGNRATSLASDEIQILWDEKQMKEVNREVERVSAETLALSELLKEYVNSVETIENNLDSLGASEALKILKTGVEEFVVPQKENFLINLNGVSTAKPSLSPFKKIPRILKNLGKKSRILPRTSTFRRMLPALEVISGIWNVITGANKIKNGSFLAKEFRKVTETLSKAVNNILAAYQIDLESFYEEYNIGIRFDAQNRSEEWRGACFHGDMCVQLALLSYNVTASESEEVCRRYGLYHLAVHSKRVSDTVRGFVGKYSESSWFSNASRYQEWVARNPDSEGHCVYFSGTSPYLVYSVECDTAYLSSVICS